MDTELNSQRKRHLSNLVNPIGQHVEKIGKFFYIRYLPSLSINEAVTVKNELQKILGRMMIRAERKKAIERVVGPPTKKDSSFLAAMKHEDKGVSVATRDADFMDIYGKSHTQSDSWDD